MWFYSWVAIVKCTVYFGSLDVTWSVNYRIVSVNAPVQCQKKLYLSENKHCCCSDALKGKSSLLREHNCSHEFQRVLTPCVDTSLFYFVKMLWNDTDMYGKRECEPLICCKDHAVRLRVHLHCLHHEQIKYNCLLKCNVICKRGAYYLYI